MYATGAETAPTRDSRRDGNVSWVRRRQPIWRLGDDLLALG